MRVALTRGVIAASMSFVLAGCSFSFPTMWNPFSSRNKSSDPASNTTALSTAPSAPPVSGTMMPPNVTMPVSAQHDSSLPNYPGTSYPVTPYPATTVSAGTIAYTGAPAGGSAIPAAPQQQAAPVAQAAPGAAPQNSPYAAPSQPYGVAAQDPNTAAPPQSQPYGAGAPSGTYNAAAPTSTYTR